MKMEYQICNGTSYNKATSVKLMQLLEQLRIAGTKVRVWYGDNVTGASWNEENDTIGKIGRSTGSIKIPLLIAGNDSGGFGLLDSCIVHMIDVKTKKVLYTHKLFKMPIAKVVDRSNYDFPRVTPKEYTHAVLLNGVLYAQCKSLQVAERYAEFMTGKRVNK